MGAVALFLVAVAVRAMYELARVALVNMRKVRLLDLEQRDRAHAAAVRALNDHSSRLLATAEVGTTLGTVAAAGLAFAKWAPPVSAWFSASLSAFNPDQLVATLFSYAVITFSSAFVIFIFGRLLPEAIAQRYPEPIAIASLTGMRISSILFAPLVRISVILSNWLSLPFGAKRRQNAAMVTEEEIITMVDASEEGGLIEEEEKEMILSVLDLGDRVAREVMVPRIDVMALDATRTVAEALDFVVTSGHSRIPVFEGDIDHIVGVLYSKDLLKLMRSGETPTLRQIMRKTHFTVESKRISELLQELQTKRMHLCIVVDEFGGTSGVVTVEDILEEIVGEIQDEYDEHEEADVTELADHTGYVLDAGMQIDSVNDLLKIELPTDQSDTLAGFIYDQLGEVPKVGATVIHEPSRTTFEVLGINDRRILKVKVMPPNRLRVSDNKKPDIGGKDER